MSDFISFLPSETISNIISHLGQRDYVECMRVSHLWYNRMSSCTTTIWDRLEVSSESWETYNNCMMRCLGPHVHTVLIRSMSTVKVLAKLREMNCSIRSLEIESHATYTRTDRSQYKFLSNDTMQLLEAIGAFDSTLKEISIKDQKVYISVHDILLRLSNLTHLTLLFDGWPVYAPRGSLGDISSSTLDMNVTFPNITYLNLDSTIANEQKIQSILRHCPELISLIISADHWIPGNDTTFDILFTPSPNIRHLIWRIPKYPPRYVRPRLDKWKSATKLDNYPKGTVRELVFIDYMRQAYHMEPVLERSDQVLEFLYVKVLAAVHWNFLTRLFFPCLKDLHIWNIKMTGDEWQTLIRRCPQLETVSLYLFMGIPIITQIVEALGSLEHLQHLEIRNNLGGVHLSTDEVLHWDHLSKSNWLRSLELNYLCFSRDSLLSLCKIPSLRELRLGARRHEECCTAESILEFTDALSTSNTELNKLTLIAFSNMTDAALENLARMDNLLQLSITRSNFITGDGVNVFLNGCSRKYQKVRKVYIDDCTLVSSGLWQISNA